VWDACAVGRHVVESVIARRNGEKLHFIWLRFGWTLEADHVVWSGPDGSALYFTVEFATTAAQQPPSNFHQALGVSTPAQRAVMRAAIRTAGEAGQAALHERTHPCPALDVPEGLSVLDLPQVWGPAWDPNVYGYLSPRFSVLVFEDGGCWWVQTLQGLPPEDCCGVWPVGSATITSSQPGRLSDVQERSAALQRGADAVGEWLVKQKSVRNEAVEPRRSDQAGISR
jgi:hypothetical protein